MSQILFLLTGSIACYKACEVISQLVQRGHRVRAVATEAALQFVGATTLEALTGERVAHELFAEGGALEHIELVRRADLVIVCPATANTMNALAAGLAPDLAGSLLLAHDWKQPLLIAPAMNPAMWAHPATVAGVARLRGWGVRFIAPGRGRTACGEVGEGRLAEPAEILAAIDAALVTRASRGRMLVTSGGTAEPVDAVRVLTNHSTGATGARLAAHFARAGYEVVLLRAESACGAGGSCVEETFTTFADLDRQLTRLLGERDFDAVIHAAAVSDFAIDRIEIDGEVRAPGSGKLGSGSAPVLHLRRNPKLLDTLRARSRNPAVRIVAFKLTHGAEAAAVRTAVEGLTRAGAADWVVHNDRAAQRAAGDAFPAEIWSAHGAVVARCADRGDIGPALAQLLAGVSGPAAAGSAPAPAG
jgi:phosphopantothenoylcysteine decarboxylase / phosphopantothenate---cysteine ligase